MMTEETKQELKDFKYFLQHTLIPDLQESGMHETAADFETCLKFITELEKQTKQ